MSDSPVEMLVQTAAQNPELMRRFREARTVEDLRSTVTAAGFDPDHPEIAAAIAASSELTDTELQGVSGGEYNGGFYNPQIQQVRDHDSDSGW